MSFLGLTELRGENSVSSSQPIICVPKRTHRFRQNSPSLPQNSVRLSEFSPPTQYPRNSILPVSYFLGEQLFPLKVGLRWVFCQWAEMGPKVGQKWVFGVQKWVRMRRNPLLHPLKTHFGIFTKPTFDPIQGGWKLFSKNGPDAVPTRHNKNSK